MPYSLIRACPNCGARNRVGARHLTASARCGACQTSIGPVSDPLDVTADEFLEIIEAVRQPILVDFWAEWCGPCRTSAPEVRALAGEMAGRAVVLKVDTEAHPDIAARYAVRAIPNFVVLKGGRMVHQHAGLVSKSDMRQWLEGVRT